MSRDRSRPLGWIGRRAEEQEPKVMWVLLPPVLMLIFGSAVAWTIQGFRP
jgi:hypothetical protein